MFHLKIWLDTKFSFNVRFQNVHNILHWINLFLAFHHRSLFHASISPLFCAFDIVIIEIVVKPLDDLLLRVRRFEFNSVDAVLIRFTARFLHVSDVNVIAAARETRIEERLVVIVSEFGGGKAQFVIVAPFLDFSSVSIPLAIAVGAFLIAIIAAMHPRH